MLTVRGSATVFGDKVETLAESLESALLSYETIATRKRPGSDTFRPVLLPTLKFGENSASGQSLGSMGAFLRETTQTLEARLQDVDTLADMLEDFDAKSLDEIEEMFEFPAEEGPEADRRGKIAQELQALHARCRSKLESSLRESWADEIVWMSSVLTLLLSVRRLARSRPVAVPAPRGFLPRLGSRRPRRVWTT